MEQERLRTFFESLNTLRYRVHLYFKPKRPLEDLYPIIDKEFIRLANALEAEKGSPKSYRMVKVDFSTLSNGWVTVAAKDGFTIRLWLDKKSDFHKWVNLPESEKYHRINKYTLSKRPPKSKEDKNINGVAKADS
ncbi:hypothetical protein D5W64_12230 [Salmonella enterica subsp. enterica serovar Saintpaul]|nr:hypothetical protein [Salmonella enterica subsp. enterica serovar Saintpaul]